MQTIFNWKYLENQKFDENFNCFQDEEEYYEKKEQSNNETSSNVDDKLENNSTNSSLIDKLNYPWSHISDESSPIKPTDREIEHEKKTRNKYLSMWRKKKPKKKTESQW